MNPIERVFTSVIQAFLRIAVELVKGLFGFGKNTDDDPVEQEDDLERD